MKAAMFWSGGKDSSFALYKVLKETETEVAFLVTTINEEYRRISMHGIRENLLDAQVASIGIPLKKMLVPKECTNELYEENLLQVFAELKKEGVEAIIYGDIFLEDLKVYREKLLEKAGLTGLFPLWKEDTALLVNEFIALGFKSILCCVKSDLLAKEFAGKLITEELINQLPADVDSCGENGEFHSFCYAGPIFKQEIKVEIGETVFKPYEVKTAQDLFQHGFWFTDLLVHQ
ncbi:Dph6-related ATP pyrophosphatase [Solitalea canadensis]|uniref:PP-loop superfamily ATP-utilizing enzyme n=1 Tax=Solitalea canadensis (strain ATCC 29591 / DSM 3403 / JCM 21819 / LMG 8368 / NBRC 15130 / NCIMB 12057 / USAM 9D) TaxID=929556 RepID=H8KVJ7_SOLCM|nr:diphthine--ammonia ligase [Solitalea canadensis]AFD06500.1 PP-loop superfamily ATP-utilizing enzyme [Solitalea canadensis DSM 3403]